LVFLLLALTITFSGLFGLVLIRGLGAVYDIDFEGLMGGLSDNSTITERNFFRISILVNHLTMFVIPGIAVALFVYGKQWLFKLLLNSCPTFPNMLGGVILLLVSMPFVQFLFWFNQEKVPLPDWVRTIEEGTADAIKNILVSESPYEFLFNVLIIALIPAIGEELIFRGIIQKQLTNKLRNPIVGIWIAAFIFSAFHMQFEGFLPRFVLGALLGYLYYWSGSLWVPVMAHFMNNFLQILAQYLFQKEITELDIEEIEMISFWQWAPSLVLVFFVGYFLWHYNKRLKNNTSNNISNNTNTYL
jgi:membrane protease YdiL (CAAX protease family)